LDHHPNLTNFLVFKVVLLKLVTVVITVTLEALIGKQIIKIAVFNYLFFKSIINLHCLLV